MSDAATVAVSPSASPVSMGAACSSESEYLCISEPDGSEALAVCADGVFVPSSTCAFCVVANDTVICPPVTSSQSLSTDPSVSAGTYWGIMAGVVVVVAAVLFLVAKLRYRRTKQYKPARKKGSGIAGSGDPAFDCSRGAGPRGRSESASPLRIVRDDRFLVTTSLAASSSSSSMNSRSESIPPPVPIPVPVPPLPRLHAPARSVSSPATSKHNNHLFAPESFSRVFSLASSITSKSSTGSASSISGGEKSNMEENATAEWRDRLQQHKQELKRQSYQSVSGVRDALWRHRLESDDYVDASTAPVAMSGVLADNDDFGVVLDIDTAITAASAATTGEEED
ncbi:hypothetical protein HDU82_007053 [Entophlyctis luteolus]|nr:hypothetical protein HDU82_007053 [Entophlyctis luteolus]